jgi:hypothetical protein
MEPRPNLADPDFEPTDEQLAELMRRAFADVPAKKEASLRQLRARIAKAREESLQRLRSSEVKAKAAD